MGTTSSKIAQKVDGKSNEEEKGSIPSTPILTPKAFRENLEKESWDPRSPSKHISRTPIELLSAAASKLSTLTIETGESDNLTVETPLKRHLILGIDPRSPTLELQRTPIVVSASPDKNLPSRIRNKNLDKVRNSALLSTPKGVPPKLLDSNPVTPKVRPDAYKRKSFVLLETNIDFTETDLDAVIKEKYLGKSLQNLSTLEDTSYSEVNDPRSPTVEFTRTPIQITKSSDPIADNPDSEHIVNVDKKVLLQDLVNDEVQHIVEPDANSEEPDIIPQDLPEDIAPAVEENNAIELFETEVISSKISENEKVITTIVEELISEIIENNCVPQDFQTNTTDTVLPKQEVCPPEITTEKAQLVPKSAPVSPPHVITVTPKKSKSQPITPPIINLTADVKELDKKLTNLIYEDEDLGSCPRVMKVKEQKEQSRTPLGLRNGTHNKKSVHKLKVSDKPRKSEFALSKIPVFKEKKIKVQCENTPPRGMRNIKNKKSHWDPKDDTLVI